MTAALFPHFKKSAQHAGVRLVGAQLNGVNVCPAEQFEQFRLRFHLPLGERGALAPVAGVHFNDFPDRKSTRLNSSHTVISYAVFCLKKKKTINIMSTSS